MFTLVRNTCLIALLGTVPAAAEVGDPTIRTNHPQYAGEGAFQEIEDCVRFATAGEQAPQDRAIAMYLWMLNHQWHLMSPQEWCIPGRIPDTAVTRDYESVVYDANRARFSYGYGLCGTVHAKLVGDSGRPVMISHHLHLDAPEYDWPAEDLAAYYDAIRGYNVVAIFNGHTHGSPPKHRRWDGKRIGPDVEGIDNYDPDDAGASKLHKGKPVGLAHGLLYVEIIDRPGSSHDQMKVRSYVTRDNWETARWDRFWEKPIESPDRDPVDRPATP